MGQSDGGAAAVPIVTMCIWRAADQLRFDFPLDRRCKTWNVFPLPRSVRPLLIAQSAHNSGPPGHDDVHGRGHWPSAEQTLDMIDLLLTSSDRPGRRPLFSCMKMGFKWRL